MRRAQLACAILLAAQGVLWAASQDLYRQRREALSKACHGGVVVLFGRTDAEAEGPLGFRQDPAFLYLTGWREPGAMLLVAPPADLLFAPAADARRERYYGKSAVPQGFGASLPVEKFESELRAALERYPKLYTVGEAATARLKALAPLRHVASASGVLAGLRMRKSADEIAAIEKAVEVSMAAHRAVWRRATAGLAEFQLAATLVGEFLERGCEGAAYPPIVASGPNGMVLHYSRNDRRLDGGQTLLIDAGAMCQGYAADITRTIPVGGRFNKRQGEIYEVVLGAQKAAIAAVKPGATIADLNRVAREYIEGRGMGQFWAHGVTHHVGLEVHDAADNSVPLAEGMVITVEPGLYAVAENIAVRIEDMVLVTRDGSRVLSASLPKELREVEQALGR